MALVCSGAPWCARKFRACTADAGPLACCVPAFAALQLGAILLWHQWPPLTVCPSRLSSSALADPLQGFGTCRLLGFVLASCRGTDAACRDSDVPHLALEQTLLGDQVGCCCGGKHVLRALWCSLAQQATLRCWV